MAISCPCQSGQLFTACCQPLLLKTKSASTAEQLMRSRYTAYTLSDWKYIFKTWHKTSRPSLPELRSNNNSDAIEWINLKILSSEKGQQGDSTGIVEFVATYKDQQGPSQIRECSQFVFEKGQWLYLDAIS